MYPQENRCVPVDGGEGTVLTMLCSRSVREPVPGHWRLAAPTADWSPPLGRCPRPHLLAGVSTGFSKNGWPSPCAVPHTQPGSPPPCPLNSPFKPQGAEAAFRQAHTLFARRQYAAALDAGLMSVRAERGWRDEAARKLLLCMFEALGSSHPAVVPARSRLSNIWFL